LINTTESQEKAFVYSRGRLRTLPEGLVVIVPSKIGPFLRSGLLSWPGIIRMGMDLVIPERSATLNDESLAAFFRRRLGREAFERLIEPLMAGIYAGDAEQMSIRATFPRFPDMERRYGSLIRGLMAGGSEEQASGRLGEKRTTFVTLRDGLSTMTEALVTHLQRAGATLVSGLRVTGLRFRGGSAADPRYDLLFDKSPTVSADAVVLATPAFVSSHLVHPLSGRAAQLLDAIPYVSTATVSLAYATATLGTSVRGFGFVVPRVEQRELLAATWTSLKWSHRAPPSETLIRCYVGGVGRESLVKSDDAVVIRCVRQELKEIAGVTCEPHFVEVNRWERGMPQYTVGHLGRLDEIDRSLQPFPGLYLTGSGYRGIGIPDCIRDGTGTAEHVIRDLLALP
jgi:oxygen-dependent protoporphyrinogen oxidase